MLSRDCDGCSLLHICRTRVGEPLAGAPGALRISQGRLWAVCGQGSSLELLELQLEGRKRVAAGAFLSGQRLSENEVVGEGAS